MRSINKHLFHNSLMAAVLSLPIALAVVQSAQAASNDTFKQQILPLDCIFEIVNDGLNTVNYLTPETCLPAIVQPTENLPTPSASPIINLFRESFIRTQEGSGQASNATEPRIKLGGLTDISQTKESNVPATIAVGAGIATAIVIVITMALILVV